MSEDAHGSDNDVMTVLHIGSGNGGEQWDEPPHTDDGTDDEQPRMTPAFSGQGKSIVVGSQPGGFIDGHVVRSQFYNSFNMRLLPPKTAGKPSGIIGVTSTNNGEGKTTVACNLAIALSMGSGMKTILVDMDTQTPRLHEIFQTSPRPGLFDALEGDEVFVSPTKVDSLTMLAAGHPGGKKLGLEHLGALRRVLSTLAEEYQFVIVDMPAVGNRRMPPAFANQMDGVVLVVDTQKTGRRDINRTFRLLAQDQVLGFVFNRVKDDDL